MWNYSGPGDEMKISADLSVEEIEKLARRFTKLTKKDSIPSECLVKPYSSEHRLPKVCAYPHDFSSAALFSLLVLTELYANISCRSMSA